MWREKKAGGGSGRGLCRLVRFDTYSVSNINERLRQDDLDRGKALAGVSSVPMRFRMVSLLSSLVRLNGGKLFLTFAYSLVFTLIVKWSSGITPPIPDGSRGGIREHCRRLVQGGERLTSVRSSVAESRP